MRAADIGVGGVGDAGACAGGGGAGDGGGGGGEGGTATFVSWTLNSHHRSWRAAAAAETWSGEAGAVEMGNGVGAAAEISSEPEAGAMRLSSDATGLATQPSISGRCRGQALTDWQPSTRASSGCQAAGSSRGPRRSLMGTIRPPCCAAAAPSTTGRRRRSGIR